MYKQINLQGVPQLMLLIDRENRTAFPQANFSQANLILGIDSSSYLSSKVSLEKGDFFKRINYTNS